MKGSADGLSPLEIDAKVSIDHDEGDLLPSVGLTKTVDDSGLEPHLTFIRKYLSMEDVSYATSKERLKKAGRQELHGLRCAFISANER